MTMPVVLVCKAKKASSADLIHLFVQMIRGCDSDEDEAKASQEMKGALSKAGLAASEAMPFQTMADVTSEHNCLKRMMEGPFVAERVNMAKAIKSKCTMLSSMTMIIIMVKWTQL